MQLVLIRHGMAEMLGPDGTDRGRRLTRAGIDQTRCAAQALTHLIDTPELLLCSPKTRAQQTAALIGEALNVEPQVVDLIAQEDLPKVLTYLHGLGDFKRVAVVGHEPTLSRLVEFFCCGSPLGCVDMTPSGAACLELMPLPEQQFTRATLSWLASGTMLAMMGRRDAPTGSIDASP